MQLQASIKFYLKIKQGIRMIIFHYRIDPGAKLAMPSKSTLVGTRTWLAGLLIGVEDLAIGYGGDVVFLSSAQTAQIERGNLVRDFIIISLFLKLILIFNTIVVVTTYIFVISLFSIQLLSHQSSALVL